jgi:hypothetical protein
MQMMSFGSRSYLLQQGDVSDVREPVLFNKAGFEGCQPQVAYNKNPKKRILMTGAQTPITDSTPEVPMGKYDDHHLDDKRKKLQGPSRRPLLRRKRSRKNGQDLRIQHRRNRPGHASQLL